MLGLERVEASAFANVYDAAGTHLRVTLVERLAEAPYTVLGWRVQDIAATVAALRAAGVMFRRYASLEQDEHDTWTAPGGARIAWFSDADGNTVSLQQEADG